MLPAARVVVAVPGADPAPDRRTRPADTIDEGGERPRLWDLAPGSSARDHVGPGRGEVSVRVAGRTCTR